MILLLKLETARACYAHFLFLGSIQEFVVTYAAKSWLMNESNPEGYSYTHHMCMEDYFVFEVYYNKTIYSIFGKENYPVRSLRISGHVNVGHF